jgi:hypothetical protein
MQKDEKAVGVPGLRSPLSECLLYIILTESMYCIRELLVIISPPSRDTFKVSPAQLISC